MPWNNTLNFSIQITDSAFKRMMTDEDFKNRAMSKIKEDASVCRPPIVSCMITVDENGYRGVSYNDYNSGITTFKAHSKGNDSFYVKKADQKAVYKRQEEKRYLEKLQEEKRIEKERLDDWIAGLEANRRLKGDVENNSGTMSEMKMIQVTTAIKAYEDSASFL